MKHIILSLFNWRDGTYRIEEGQACDDIVPLQMSTVAIILEGVQALDWQVIRKGLPSMKTVLRPSVRSLRPLPECRAERGPESYSLAY